MSTKMQNYRNPCAELNTFGWFDESAKRVTSRPANAHTTGGREGGSSRTSDSTSAYGSWYSRTGNNPEQSFAVGVWLASANVISSPLLRPLSSVGEQLTIPTPLTSQISRNLTISESTSVQS